MIVLQESSRSHAVFTIIVEHATYDGSGGNTVTIGETEAGGLGRV